MKKLKSLIVVLIIILEVFWIQGLSYSAFYDLEHPPNSTGRTDYTDEEADSQRTEGSASNSEQYVGKSSNTYLKSLTIENAKIEPEFNRQYLDYNVTLIDVTNKKINISAKTEDAKAIVEGTGEIELEDGTNDVRVIVTAENGDVQIYNLHIELPFKQSNLKINSLDIYGVNQKNGEQKIEKLSPNFDSGIFEYYLNVEYDITSLNIEANYEPETFILTKGIEDLVVGNNEIFISVVDNNNEDKSTTYTINVTRDENMKNTEQQILIITILAIIVLIVIIYILKHKKHKKC